MKTYNAEELLAEVVEAALREGVDANAVRTKFMADNKMGGFFNPNMQINLAGTTPQELARMYGKQVNTAPVSAALPAGTSATSGTHVATGAKTSTTSTSYPTEALDNLLEASTGIIKRGRDLIGRINATAADFDKDVSKGVDAAIRVGEKKAEGETAKGSRIAGQVDFKENLVRALGLDATDANSLVRSNMDTAAKANEVVRSLQPEIQRLRGISFADDPLAWVAAQFQLEGVAQKHNAAAKIFNDNTAAASTIQELANKQSSLQPGVNSDLVKLEAAAEAEAMKAEAIVRSVQIEGTARSARMAAMNAELGFNQQEFSNAYALTKLFGERRSLIDEQGKVSRELMDLEVVNVWRERMGLTRLEPDQWKSTNAAEKTKMQELAFRKSGDIADSPGKSINTLVDFQAFSKFRQDMPPQGQKFLDHLNRRALQLAQSQPFGLKFPKSKYTEKFQYAVDEIVQSWKDELEARRYDQLSDDNPFRMNATIYAQAASLKNNEIAKFVLAAKDGGASLKEKDLLTYSLSLVGAGRAPAEIGEQVAEFFREGYKSQSAAYRLRELAIPLDNPKSKTVEYPIDADVFGLFERFMDPRLSNSSRHMQAFNGADITHFLVLNFIKNRPVKLPGTEQMLRGQ